MSFKSARKNAGLTQSAAADRLGVTAEAVCQWETGKYKPRTDRLQEIACAYGCTIDELLTPDSQCTED